MINQNVIADSVNLKTVTLKSDEELLSLTKLASQNEKQATFELLKYLVQVDERRAYCRLACSTLFEYVVKVLGYSDSQATERVNSVRLMRTVPSVETRIESGELSLTTASQVQRFVRMEKKSGSPVSSSQVEEIVNTCSGQSKRDVEKILLSLAGEETKIQMRERVREVDSKFTELKFMIPESTFQKINEAKDLIGNESLGELFSQALDALIEAKLKKNGRVKITRLTPNLEATQKPNSTLPEMAPLDKNLLTKAPMKGRFISSPSKPTKQSRYSSIKVKREVSARSGNQCEKIDPKTKIRCSSRYRLEFDHIVPSSQGGKNTAENLRHCCRQHNLKAAMDAGLV